ncbi:MAG: transcription elongation factor GreA [Lachnospiraceae bacterium]|nr:transcription elongation factor GreA [Lachnospiraceae bacterium]
MVRGRAELTESDVKKIEKEIRDRKIIERPKLIEAVKEARAQGDLSENFEYYAAKKAKNENESRIRYLDNMLKTAIIISDSSKSGEVGLNNFVDVEFEDDKSVERYKIVTSIRGNSLKNLISIESPIGKALLGHKKGDVCTVSVKDGVSYKVKILNIDENEDDSEDEIKSF